MDNYVAFLRGINVGGKNLIRMADLKIRFEALGLEAVRTYIQSGNVIFRSGEADKAGLVSRIESELAQALGYGGSVILRSLKEMNAVVTGAPEGFGSQPDLYRYDVLFLKEHWNPAEALQQVLAKEGVDWVYAGKKELYFSRLIARASQSQLARITGTPLYQDMTVRNWNTTTRILKLMEEAPE
jgi:uncharacterized protein (DUF1697 family)